MNEEKAVRLWLDIGGIAEIYVDELEAEAQAIAAKAKMRRRVKYGTIAAAASLSAAVALMLLRPQVVTRQLARLNIGVKRAA